MVRLLLMNWLVLAIAVAALVMPGVEIDGGLGTLAGIAAIVGACLITLVVVVLDHILRPRLAPGF